MKFKNVALVGVAALSLGGCATVINGTSQDYQIWSEPNGAEVTLSNGSACTAPCEISLKRRDDYRADISLDGYQSTSVLIQSRTGGAMAGNILLGGVVGGVVDASNGSTNHLYPRPLHVQLVPEGEVGEAMLLDDDGEILSSVSVHNAELAEDLRETLGPGMVDDVPLADLPDSDEDEDD